MLLCVFMLDLALKLIKTEIYLVLNDFSFKYISKHKVFQEKWLSGLVIIFFGLKTQILGLKCEKYKNKAQIDISQILMDEVCQNSFHKTISGIIFN